MSRSSWESNTSNDALFALATCPPQNTLTQHNTPRRPPRATASSTCCRASRCWRSTASRWALVRRLNLPPLPLSPSSPPAPAPNRTPPPNPHPRPPPPTPTPPKVLRTSLLYETAPMHVTEQPAFINAAVLARTDLPPLQLLYGVKQIEKAAGRDLATGQRWGPRPLDLDIIFYGPQRIDHESLTVPHPRWGAGRFRCHCGGNEVGLSLCLLPTNLPPHPTHPPNPEGGPSAPLSRRRWPTCCSPPTWRAGSYRRRTPRRRRWRGCRRRRPSGRRAAGRRWWVTFLAAERCDRLEGKKMVD
jgi:2-amino-4-hydroxy-6-hydroxymethyldihydropteridine diphosphokinase